jgi:hypothetical protein
MIQVTFEKYKVRKNGGAASVQSTPASSQPPPLEEQKADAEMSNEEETPKVDPKIEAKNKVFFRYEAKIRADKLMMAQEENNEQNPLSHAYISTCSFAKTKVLSKEEEK